VEVDDADLSAVPPPRHENSPHVSIRIKTKAQRFDFIQPS